MDPAKKLEKLAPEEYTKQLLEANSFQNWTDLFKCACRRQNKRSPG
jgi:hypothetical protein